jgi:nitrile hydratase subunit alpha
MHEHGHDHGEDGHHHPLPLSEVALRAQALEALLIEKGLVSSDAIDEVIELYENDIGPQNGARVVARAWADAGFADRLRSDATAAIGELGFAGEEGSTVRAVFNQPGVHNVIVCTLCSCYPWPLLGLPPTWYKSPPYRARVVAEPRAVLREFGLELPDDVDVRVWDSTAEVRYIVVPERPAGSDDLDEQELARLVTRDSMIGTGLPLEPAVR